MYIVRLRRSIPRTDRSDIRTRRPPPARRSQPHPRRQLRGLRTSRNQAWTRTRETASRRAERSIPRTRTSSQPRARCSTSHRTHSSLPCRACEARHALRSSCRWRNPRRLRTAACCIHSRMARSTPLNRVPSKSCWTATRRMRASLRNRSSRTRSSTTQSLSLSRSSKLSSPTRRCSQDTRFHHNSRPSR